MSKDILNDLQIDPCLTKAGGKGVPEDMTAKARKKDRVLIKIGLQQDLIVAISGNPLDGLIKCALVLHITVTVDFGVLSRIKTPFPGEKDKCIAYPLTPTKKALIYAGLKGSKA